MRVLPYFQCYFLFSFVKKAKKCFSIRNRGLSNDKFIMIFHSCNLQEDDGFIKQDF